MMKLTLQIQLLPDQEQAALLRATLERFNEAADWLAGEAFARQCANKFGLHKLYYHELRQRFGLSAQMAVRCLAQVCEAYSRDKSIRPHFRPLAAMPFDRKIMAIQTAIQVCSCALQTLHFAVDITEFRIQKSSRTRSHLCPAEMGQG